VGSSSHTAADTGRDTTESRMGYCRPTVARRTCTTESSPMAKMRSSRRPCRTASRFPEGRISATTPHTRLSACTPTCLPRHRCTRHRASATCTSGLAPCTRPRESRDRSDRSGWCSPRPRRRHRFLPCLRRLQCPRCPRCPRRWPRLRCPRCRRPEPCRRLPRRRRCLRVQPFPRPLRLRCMTPRRAAPATPTRASSGSSRSPARFPRLPAQVARKRGRDSIHAPKLRAGRRPGQRWRRQRREAR
jgi:hypothetical protein